MRRISYKKTAKDAAYEAGRAIVSILPAVGGPLQVLFENVFQAPLDKRKQAWLEELVGIVEELQKRIEGFRPEALAKSEAFISVALQASQIALRNHKREKLDALRNAVLNSALPTAPSEDEQIIFLRFVDDLTPSHLRLLTFLDSPARWMEVHEISHPDWFMGGVATVLEHCFPDFVNKRDIYDQLVQDLQTEGLATVGSYLHMMMTKDGMLATRTSSLGKRFLAFVSKPA
jgi:hypothetical protein